MDVSVNYLAVFLAAASSMVVGSIWYANGVFGKTWAKLAKVDMGKKVSGSQMAVLLGLTFVASLVTAYVLAHVAFLSNEHFQNAFIQDTLSTAFWLWLGLTAARIFTHDLFEGRPSKLTLLSVGNELATLLVMALIIGGMGHPGV
jgi:hypothetical protein